MCQKQVRWACQSSIPYSDHCISRPLGPIVASPEGEGFVYNVNIVRQLCAEIAREKDSQRVQELLSLLHAVIREDQEEIRIRMAFLAKKYPSVVAESQAD